MRKSMVQMGLTDLQNKISTKNYESQDKSTERSTGWGYNGYYSRMIKTFLLKTIRNCILH